MRVSYITKDNIINFDLPKKKAGNYWITDNNDEEARNVINIKALDDKWEMTSNSETTIIFNAQALKSVFLENNTFYSLKEYGKDSLSFIYTSDVFDKSFKVYEATGDVRLKIGKATDASIIYSNLNIKDTNNELIYQGGNWIINDLSSQFGTYVNNKRVSSKVIKNGDVVFIMGLRIIVLGKLLIINNPKNQVRINTNYLLRKNLEKESENSPKVKDVDPALVELYTEDEYFSRSPRFKSNIMTTKIKVNNPPSFPQNKERPAILVIGPMVTMGMASVGTLFNVVSRLAQGAELMSVFPQLLMSSTMMAGTFLWPFLTRKYEKKMLAQNIKDMTKKYKEYIDTKRKQIALIGQGQRDSLLDNNVSLNECESIIKSRNRRLWERDLSHNDFLNLRLGLGNKNIELEIDSSGGDSNSDGDLANYMNDMISASKILYDVPITESLIRKNVIAIEGKKIQSREFINNLILQMITFHSYRDLKIIIFSSEDNKENWDFTKSLPHCWNDSHDKRYVAFSLDEMKEISFILEQDLKKRSTNPETGEAIKFNGDDAATVYKRYLPYYVIITDNFKYAKDLQIISDIVNNPINMGFSILISGENLKNVPSKTRAFISLGDKSSTLFGSEMLTNRQKNFIQDKADYNIELVSKKLANIPIAATGGEFSLPDMISFLGLYKAGMIDQLNPLNRWKKNNPVVSLGVPIGVGTNGELFKLDLHEKYHGPHGLIAGMTGSGKSEFIITYILSLAINFSPEEVQFVLIDYKGGGLAGAFENRETGVKLPHLIGTITNLDVTEINRSLLSIQSELKRRQAAFNKARDKLNESTMDIYKYQKYYRAGALDEPISHLLLISDEFAELKSQQPDFMDELISTARIGRSLGVHLILATQKPGGVVNDQIWSNSKFRVCLKVQDAGDSKEMIRRPDAAGLKQAGRFYLQVGYDEFFAMGQSAWAGAQYIPSEKVVKQIDDSLEFLDETGNVIKTINNELIEERKAQGEELPNIMKFLHNIAISEKLESKRLWLERIPNDIFLDKLKEKYNYQKVDNYINPVIGEYDLPAFQKQEILTIPLSEKGNVYIVGVSGKDMFFRSLIYSLAETYTPEEVNMYVLDFDTESLKMYSDNIMVGDIMVASEGEKIQNFFKMIDKIKEERKRILKNYNGDYQFYLKHGDKPMPMIVIMIIGVETFLESFASYEDYLKILSRDSQKYGISLIVGASAENGLRSTISRNFNIRYSLEMNNPDDYRSFLGIRSKLLPSKGVARGLLAIDGEAYEYQTARFAADELINEKVQELAKILKEKYKTGAKKVPTLPDIVRLEDVNESFTSLSDVSFGLTTDELEYARFDLHQPLFTTLTSEFTENMIDLTKTLVEGIKKIPNTSLQFWDGNREFKDHISSEYYVSQDFINILNQLKPYLESQSQKLKDANMDYSVLQDQPNILIMTNDFGSIYANCKGDDKTLMNQVLALANLTKTLNFLVIDSATNIKKYRYDEWYTNFIDAKEGIYVGNNIGTANYQFSYEPRSLRETLTNDYGYIIKKGIPTRVKFISSKKKEGEE